MDNKTDKKTETAAVSEETVEVEVHYKEMSPAMMVARRFFRSRLSLVGVVLLAALFAFSFLFSLTEGFFSDKPVNGRFYRVGKSPERAWENSVF